MHAREIRGLPGRHRRQAASRVDQGLRDLLHRRTFRPGAELSAVMELARRIRERAQDPGDKLDAPLKVWARMEPLAAGLTVEKCWVLCLNRRNRLLALHEVSSGTATSALLHPREVFRQALRHGAPAAIVAHNLSLIHI